MRHRDSVEHELQLKRSQLNFDMKEMRLLKESRNCSSDSPGCAARRASQSMKNAHRRHARTRRSGQALSCLECFSRSYRVRRGVSKRKKRSATHPPVLHPASVPADACSKGLEISEATAASSVAPKTG
jgi:hypothetical protein